MRTVNALALRNQLGSILDMLEQEGSPILVSKGRKVRAVLVTPEDFQTRFLDMQAEEARQRLMGTIAGLRGARTRRADSVSVLRKLRGYGR